MTPYEILPQLLDGAVITYDNRKDKWFTLVNDKVKANDGEVLTLPEWLWCDALDWHLANESTTLYKDLALGDRFKWADVGVTDIIWIKCADVNISTNNWLSYERTCSHEQRKVIKIEE